MQKYIIYILLILSFSSSIEAHRILNHDSEIRIGNANTANDQTLSANVKKALFERMVALRDNPLNGTAIIPWNTPNRKNRARAGLIACDTVNHVCSIFERANRYWSGITENTVGANRNSDIFSRYIINRPHTTVHHIIGTPNNYIWRERLPNSPRIIYTRSNRQNVVNYDIRNLFSDCVDRGLPLINNILAGNAPLNVADRDAIGNFFYNGFNRNYAHSEEAFVSELQHPDNGNQNAIINININQFDSYLFYIVSSRHPCSNCQHMLNELINNANSRGILFNVNVVWEHMGNVDLQNNTNVNPVAINYILNPATYSFNPINLMLGVPNASIIVFHSGDVMQNQQAVIISDTQSGTYSYG